MQWTKKKFEWFFVQCSCVPFSVFVVSFFVDFIHRGTSAMRCIYGYGVMNFLLLQNWKKMPVHGFFVYMYRYAVCIYLILFFGYFLFKTLTSIRKYISEMYALANTSRHLIRFESVHIWIYSIFVWILVQKGRWISVFSWRNKEENEILDENEK